MDLNPKISDLNERKYLIRVLTKSHPWGYRIKRESNGNGITLQMKDRRDALEFFRTKEDTSRYIDLSPENICPWDAYYPVPLSFILNYKDTFEEYTSVLRTQLSKLQIKTLYSGGKVVCFDDIGDATLLTFYNVSLTAKNLYIPEIVVDSELLKNDNLDTNVKTIKDDTVDQIYAESSQEQDPTLFVRLNAGGTRITGDELLYSIYKAAFPSFKDLVEKIGRSFIAPSKLITLVSRLIQCETKGYTTFPVELKIKPFRDLISNNHFKQQIPSYVGDLNNSEAKKLIDTAVLILNQDNQIEIPAILIKQFINQSHELFLVLLIFIKKHKLHLAEISLHDVKDISSTYVYLLWFGRDKRKIASALFASLKMSDNSGEYVQWSNATRDLTLQKLTIPLLAPHTFKKVMRYIIKKGQLTGDLLNVDHYSVLINDKKFMYYIQDHFFINLEVNVQNLITTWGEFVKKVIWNRDLILFAQREYMCDKFKEFNQYENVEDTNKPWDWDHIYPISWVYNKDKINQFVKFWVNSIGNLRALSYDDNRSESNSFSPEERLNIDDNRLDSFVNNDNYKDWQLLNASLKRIRTDNHTGASMLINAVVNRTINIYEKWYDEYYKLGD